MLMKHRLAATIGKNSQKKLSRKAIQEVDVPKACDKIIHPEAPLALRLQGNLLYGVSRVFSQQCIYMLTDAERCRSDMLSYFRGLHQNELDPEAGKTK
jgi:meiotic recombination protein REC8, fungi type